MLLKLLNYHIFIAAILSIFLYNIINNDRIGYPKIKMNENSNLNNSKLSIIESNGIEISAQDKRNYQHINSETDSSSAAMDVHVGYYQDSNNLPGLAHFLEHMLFLGTEKYPDENSYNQYLSSHSGHSNAYTSATDTNYYFDVDPNHFYNALDRFAQFFITPLFTPSATEREMNAVNSENAKNQQDDGWRNHQMLRSLAKVDHLFHKFGTGNIETLTQSTSNVPLKNNNTEYNKETAIHNTRQELLNFHAKYYSAHRMRLVLYGKEPIETLKQWANELFSNIQNKKDDKTQEISLMKDTSLPFDTNLGKIINIVPVKDHRTIEIFWQLDSLRNFYKSKPHRYLSHLLGHEGKGSLLSSLKNEHLANELSAGLTTDDENWAIFSVFIEATEKGIDEYEKIIFYIYQYINMLKVNGPKKWIFEESQQLELINFRFKNKENPFFYTSSLAARMQKYPKENIVSGDYVIKEFNPTKIQDMLDKIFVPSNMIIMISSKSFIGTTNLVEKWYQTPYSILDIPDSLLSKLESKEQKITTDVHLPHKNLLIATDFSLAKSAISDQTGQINVPKIISEEKQLYRIWYKYDNWFLKPKMTVGLHVVLPAAYSSPLYAVFTDILIRLVKDELTEWSYDAELAGLKYILRFTMDGINICVTGYNEKIEILLYEILKVLTKTISENYRNPNSSRQITFKRILDITKRSYSNFEKEQPYHHAIYDGNYLLTDKKWHISDKLAVIEKLNNKSTQNCINDFLKYVLDLFKNIYIEALIHGNIIETNAIEIMDKVISIFKSNTVSDKIFLSEFPVYRAIKLENGKNYIYKSFEPNDKNENSCAHVLYQIDKNNLMLEGQLLVLGNIIKEPFFNQLRTIEQLGYIVFSGMFYLEGILHFRFVVQSSAKSGDFLNERINHFVNNFLNDLKIMSDVEFQKFIDASIVKLQEKPKTPWDECVRYWEEIENKTFLFNKREELVKIVQKIKNDDIIQFYSDYFIFEKNDKSTGRKIKKLNNLVSSRITMEEEPKEYDSKSSINQEYSLLIKSFKDISLNNNYIINDMESFKRSMPLYSSPPPFWSINHTKIKENIENNQN